MKKITIVLFLAQIMFVGVTTAQIEISLPEKSSFGIEIGNEYARKEIGLSVAGFYSYKDLVTLKLTYLNSPYTNNDHLAIVALANVRVKSWTPEVQVHLVRPKAQNKIGLSLSSDYRITDSDFLDHDSKEFRALGNIYTKIRINENLELIPALQAGYGRVNNPYLSSKSYFAYGASLMLNWKNGPYLKGGISNAYDFGNEKLNRGFLTIGYSF